MTAFRFAAALVLSLLVAASARADDLLGHTGSYVIPTCADTGGNHLNSPGGNTLTCGNTGGSGTTVTWPTTNDIVISNTTNTPAFLAPVNNDLVYSTGGAFANLASANSSVLVTGGTGVPSLSTTLPSGIAATNMSLTTPTLGVATATSIDGLTITTSTGSLTITNGKTLTDTSAVGASLLLGAAGGGFTGYGGVTCTNQALTALSAAGASTCTSLTNAFLTAGQFTSIQGVGTLTAGTWTATLIGATYGGTGVNNGANTITVGGNLVTGGALTFANLVTTNDLLYVTSSGNVGQLASANNGVLVTSGAGAPSISTTIPTATQQNISATNIITGTLPAAQLPPYIRAMAAAGALNSFGGI